MSAAAVPDEFIIHRTADNVLTRGNLDVMGKINSVALVALAGDEQLRKRYRAQTDQWFPWVPNEEMHPWSSQTLRSTTNYLAEYNAEVERVQNFPGLPSRFTAVYAWGDLDSAKLAEERSSGRYKEANRVRLRLAEPPLRIHRANSEIVKLARACARHGGEPHLMLPFWHAYWSGAGDQLGVEWGNEHSDGPMPYEQVMTRDPPLWEWLIDGSLEVVD